MITSKKNILCLLVLAFVACTSATEKGFNALVNTAQAGDKALQINLAKLPFKADTSSLSYRIRLMPIIALTADVKNSIKEKMMYNIDSCFYLYADGRVIYPQACEAINGGIPNTYEYLVSFDMLPTILEFIGFRVEGGKLGLGITAISSEDFSSKLLDYEDMNNNLLNKSDKYLELWISNNQ